MKRIVQVNLALVLVLVGGCGCNDSTPEVKSTFPELRGDFVGQTPPGGEAQLFAPGLVSTGLETRDVAMTPDGNELYFAAFAGARAMIMVTKRGNDGVWSEPKVAPFSGEFQDIEPCISPDGSQFFFMSTRPRDGQEPKEGWVYQDLWVMDRLDDHWGPARNLGSPVNSDAPEYFPSVTDDGTIYFTREGEDRQSVTYRSRRVDGIYTEPEALPEQVNLGTNRFNVFVAPDESFVIVPAIGGPDSLGGVDYYVVHRNEDDTWNEPINLGPAINNATGKEWSASLSPDGKYLFFMSSRTVGEKPKPMAGTTLSHLVDRASEPGHGSAGIWWVEAESVLPPR